MLIELVDLDVLETLKTLHMPVGIADVILSESVLNQIDLVLNFDGECLWDNDNLAELAE